MKWHDPYAFARALVIKRTCHIIGKHLMGTEFVDLFGMTKWHNPIGKPNAITALPMINIRDLHRAA